jgi:alkylation response protein AidB-like acyl-CoA dehydrogenase
VQFDFSEEQEMMRGEARRFLAGKCPSRVVRDILESERAHDAALWRAVADNGWAGIAIPEAHGGVGAGYLELCVLAEELGRVLAPIPFSSSIYLAAEALLLAGDESMKAQWLPRLAAGDAIGTLALSEGPGFPSFSRLACRADGKGEAVTLSGVKTPVLDGLAATVAVVAAHGTDGLGLYWVDLDQPGVARSPEPGIDDSRPLARLAFDGAAARRIGTSDAATLEALLSRAAVLFAFEQLGGAQAALDMGVAYARQRYAFGRPIGSFQAIKHRLADLYAQLELARSNCFFAAWALSTGDALLGEAAACARLAATQSFFDCAKETIQVHGGMGFTWELDGHLYYRRARLLAAAIGGQSYWREALVRTLEGQGTAARPGPALQVI